MGKNQRPSKRVVVDGNNYNILISIFFSVV
jgi:hypothetical protein